MIHPFDMQGKTAVVATMHGKERVIIPALAPLGLAFLPRPPIDTDHFGTFTRDIRRAGSQQEALAAKARAGLAATPEADYAIVGMISPPDSRFQHGICDQRALPIKPGKKSARIRSLGARLPDVADQPQDPVHALGHDIMRIHRHIGAKPWEF